ncbi:MAG: MBL fold metallo-hydrolase [Candidatus Marinimicrobia bacterium]|nr:MBL fold metallo-hydrolase [Candidatus Neomarinimicrobiota bacterium]MBT3496581.1 MBL fold metallo-hydrolase [Candidatus Neomarinimicrobiota bacterium]MBT3693002.1 MBL fold metallo-hydrolase [Candidatus Neomarinimicrobiota bacterium]MBT3731615.1 MBL fold metallo-hydrolase [Candidatus Neomarinimicrobiota bacterium]MBT4145177.1 MBL fold metallo-hydrolase [Candidatus Neomarinimicrobiota bacterium]
MNTHVLSLVTGPFQENAFLAWNDSDPNCIIIDPGDDSEKIIQEIETHNLKPIAIVNTHAHLDHIGAVDSLKDHYQIPFYLHQDESDILENFNISRQFYGLSPQAVPKVDFWFGDEEELSFGKIQIGLFKTPGHTPGGTCLIIDGHVFTGDTLFHRSIGRTDLPGGDFETLHSSLKKLVLEIPDTFILHPGHGPDTTLAVEKLENPYLK